MRLPSGEAFCEFAVGSSMLLFWVIQEGQRRGLLAHCLTWTTLWLVCVVVAGVAAWRLR